MKACFPVAEDNGLDSRVYGHFGSAPVFVAVDTATGSVSSINNGDATHAHGQCSPIKAMGGLAPDCVIVGGIGGGALGKLSAMGVKVFRAGAATVRENIELLGQGKLASFEATHVCGGHSHQGGGCSHH